MADPPSPSAATGSPHGHKRSRRRDQQQQQQQQQQGPQPLDTLSSLVDALLGTTTPTQQSSFPPRAPRAGAETTPTPSAAATASGRVDFPAPESPPHFRDVSPPAELQPRRKRSRLDVLERLEREQQQQQQQQLQQRTAADRRRRRTGGGYAAATLLTLDDDDELEDPKEESAAGTSFGWPRNRPYAPGVTSHEFHADSPSSSNSTGVDGSFAAPSSGRATPPREFDEQPQFDPQEVVVQLQKLRIDAELRRTRDKLQSVADEIWRVLVRGGWAKCVPAHLDLIQSHTHVQQSGEMLVQSVLAAFAEAVGGVDDDLGSSVPVGTSPIDFQKPTQPLTLQIQRLAARLEDRLSPSKASQIMSREVCGCLTESQEWFRATLLGARTTSSVAASLFHLLGTAQAHVAADETLRGTSGGLNAVNVAAFALAAAAETGPAEVGQHNPHSADALVPAAAQVLMNVAVGVHQAARRARGLLCAPALLATLRTDALSQSQLDAASPASSSKSSRAGTNVAEFRSVLEALAAVYFAGLSGGYAGAASPSVALFEVLLDAALRLESGSGSPEHELRALMNGNFTGSSFQSDFERAFAEDIYLKAFSHVFCVEVAVFASRADADPTRVISPPSHDPLTSLRVQEQAYSLHLERRDDSWGVIESPFGHFHPVARVSLTTRFVPHNGTLLQTCLDAVSDHGSHMLTRSAALPLLPAELFEPVIRGLVDSRNLTAELLCALLLDNPYILGLDLCSAGSLVNDGFLSQVQAIVTQRVRRRIPIACSVQVLRLSHCSVSDRGLSLLRLPAITQALEALEVEFTKIGDAGLSTILETTQSTLAHLNISGCPVTDV
jgi:hypothetical protein